MWVAFQWYGMNDDDNYGDAMRGGVRNNNVFLHIYKHIESNDNLERAMSTGATSYSSELHWCDTVCVMYACSYQSVCVLCVCVCIVIT